MGIPLLLGDEAQGVMDGAPHFRKWHETMMARPGVAKIVEDKAKVSQH